MRHNPHIHRRRSIRLPTYNYTSAGAYFITICTHDREPTLVDRLTRDIVSNAWRDLARRFPTVRLDRFVVMPNHVHGIIWITTNPVGAQHSTWTDETSPNNGIHHLNHDSLGHHAAPLPPVVESRLFYNIHAAPLRPAVQSHPVPDNAAPPRSFTVESGSLGAVVRAFKSRSAKRINRLRGTPNASVWQRNYYDHIVRDEDDLTRIRKYIIDNPAKWAEDPNNPANWPNQTP